MTRIATLLLLCLATLSGALAFPQFQQQIPNGDKVPHPCNATAIWRGVGHEVFKGQGPLNPFGKAFLANSKQWNRQLCQADSDGDGRTNGQELGDPNCQWKVGQPSPSSNQISHPGICEPITDQKCRSKNKFLESIDSCVNKLGITIPQWCPAAQNDASVKTVDLRIKETAVSANDTSYLCQQFTLPADKDYHMVAWEAIIDNIGFVHHMVMYTCNTPSDEAALQNSNLFKNPEQCPLIPGFCQTLGIVWTFGQPNRCYGNTIGQLIGKRSYSRVILQVRYNNPFQVQGARDSTGLRIYYTPKLRQNNATNFNVGPLSFAIPPRLSGTVVNSTAFTARCSQKLLGGSARYLTSVLFHMRRQGFHAKLELKKATGDKIVLVDEAYDYRRPKFIQWSSTDNAPLIEPGDNFNIFCSFNSSNRSEYTFFGEKASDEMCVAFMEVFPPIVMPTFFTYMTIDSYDNCLWLELKGNQTSPVINGCVLTEFGLQLAKMEASGKGGFMAHCPPQAGYPAKNCSQSCADFLASNNFSASNPCMADAAFRYMTIFTEFASFKDLHRVQSEVKLCLNQQTKEVSHTDEESGDGSGDHSE